MTKRTGGASQPVTDSYETLLDGYRDDVGTSPLPLTTDLALGCFQVIVQNDPGNQVNMYVGNGASQSVVLTSGQSETIPYQGKVSDIYVRFASGTGNRVNWHAMR